MRHRSIALLLPVALLLAACGTTQPSSNAASQEPSTSAAPTPAASGGSGESASPPMSVGPAESPSAPAASPTASESPAASGSPGASASTSPGIADACTGSADNRAFFASAAEGLDWTVLCAVLPERWILQTGSYRHTHGGQLHVEYGRSTQALVLDEGAFCTAADGCVPPGTDAGDASLGPLAGTFVELDDGGFAIVVDRGSSPSWLMVTHGLTAARTRAFGAALVVVGS
jgi:hypothetical protein